MAPYLDKFQVLRCRWLNSYNLKKNFFKLFENVIDIIMSRLTIIFGRRLTIYADQYGSEVANLANTISVTNIDNFTTNH